MFDPYHKWLAIPKDQRPPNYYQLLGIATGEDDPDVIEEAALMRIAHVRNYQLGPHAAECAQLLRELGVASSVLGDPKKRAEYDAGLGRAPQPAAASQAQPVGSVQAPGVDRREHSDERAVGSAALRPETSHGPEKKAAPPRVPQTREWQDPLPAFERPTASAGDPHQNTPAFEIPLHHPQRTPDEDPFEKLRPSNGHLSTAAHDHEAAMRKLSAQAVHQLRKPVDVQQDTWFVLLRNMVGEWWEQIPLEWRAPARRFGLIGVALLVAWIFVKILR